jgi:hypothetical protein
VVVIGSGVLALLLFVSLAEAARRGNALARGVAMFEAVVLIPLAAVGVFGALLLSGLKCDESCVDGGSPPWEHTTDAWQWTGQLAVAVLGLLAVGSAFALVWARSYRWAAVLMTLAAASFGAWAAFLAPLGNALGI